MRILVQAMRHNTEELNSSLNAEKAKAEGLNTTLSSAELSVAEANARVEAERQRAEVERSRIEAELGRKQHELSSTTRRHEQMLTDAKAEADAWKRRAAEVSNRGQSNSFRIALPFSACLAATRLHNGLPASLRSHHSPIIERRPAR